MRCERTRLAAIREPVSLALSFLASTGAGLSMCDDLVVGAVGAALAVARSSVLCRAKSRRVTEAAARKVYRRAAPMTLRYAHLSPKHKHAAIALINSAYAATDTKTDTVKTKEDRESGNV